MDQKTISWVSYLTLIGWIIALVTYSNSPAKSSLARFHIRQSLGILATYLALIIATVIVIFIVPLGAILYPVCAILVFILWILGLIAAVNGEEKPVPVLGELYQKTFTFIN